MIKALLYDLGDIFFEAHLWRKWMYMELKKSGNFDGQFSDFYNDYDNFLKPVYENKISYNKQYSFFVKSLGVQEPDKFIERSFIKKEYYENNRKLYNGVKNTLDRLFQNNIKNIIITDNEALESEIRTNILAKYNINRFIDYVISSKEVGKTKPDPKIFKYALDKYKLTKNEVIFVGHDKDEIDGCREIGLKVIEFNNYLKTETNADYKVNDFKEIFEIISKLNSVV